MGRLSNQPQSLKRLAIERSIGKTPREITIQVMRSKFIGEPKSVTQTLQQMRDNQTIQRTNVVLCAWKNYCRESLIYRILEKIGLR